MFDAKTKEYSKLSVIIQNAMIFGLPIQRFDEEEYTPTRSSEIAAETVEHATHLTTNLYKLVPGSSREQVQATFIKSIGLFPANYAGTISRSGSGSSKIKIKKRNMIGDLIFGKYLILALNFFYSDYIHLCNLQYRQQSSAMEITDHLLGNDAIGFIEKNFIAVNRNYQTPLSPYKINLRGNGNKITFCSIPVYDAWCLRQDTSFAFFIAMKEKHDYRQIITNEIGEPIIYSSSSFSIGQKGYQADHVNWQIGEVNIYSIGFSKFERLFKYKDCKLFIVGNIDYSKLFEFSMD